MKRKKAERRLKTVAGTIMPVAKKKQRVGREREKRRVMTVVDSGTVDYDDGFWFPLNVTSGE